MASVAALFLALASTPGAVPTAPAAMPLAQVRVLARAEIVRAETAAPDYRPDQTRRTLRRTAQGDQQIEFE